MRATQRLLAGLALLAAAATAALAAGAEISGIDKIYLRSGPGSEQPAIGVLSAGDHVDILDIEGSWTKIQTEDGRVGYIYHRYVTPRVDDSDPTAQQGVPTPLLRPTVPVVTRPTVAAAPAGAVLAPAVGAVPVATRAPVAPPQAGAMVPPSTIEKPPSAELSAELAALRTELSELKEKIQQRQSELTGDANIASGAAPTDSLATELTPVVTPALLSARDQSIGVLAIALFSLVIGWVLGSAFGRRGPRSQRGGRLRF